MMIMDWADERDEEEGCKMINDNWHKQRSINQMLQDGSLVVREGLMTSLSTDLAYLRFY